MEESLLTRVITWINAISKQFDTGTFSSRYDGSYMVYRPKWYQKHNYRLNLVPYWL